MRLMLSPQMMSLLAAYIAFEVKQGTERAVIQESGAPWRAFSAPIKPLVLP